MVNMVLVGCQWGDEGKGKVVDYISEGFDIIARFQGGHNAGHTIETAGKKFVLHIIPTGILHSDKKCVVGNGTVVSLPALISEIEMLKKEGISTKGRLFISNRAHLIMPYHSVLDDKSEDEKKSKKIGTTGRGIGPTYSSKSARCGIRIADLSNPELFREKVKLSLGDCEDREGKSSLESLCKEYQGYYESLKECFTDTSILLDDAIKDGKKVLFEGAQGTLLDLDHGTYPYVTSSNSVSGGACTGCGIGPNKITNVIGITKAYTTRVGNGPFPSESTSEIGERFRDIGGEYGATTGRPRRCGWLDIPALRYAIRVNGIDKLVLTKLDVLDTFETIQMCTAYKWNGQIINEFPAELDILEECSPIYEESKGWMACTSGIRSADKLPKLAQEYVNKIEELVGVKCSIISVGSKREETIIKDSFFSNKATQSS